MRLLVSHETKKIGEKQKMFYYITQQQQKNNNNTLAFCCDCLGGGGNISAVRHDLTPKQDSPLRVAAPRWKKKCIPNVDFSFVLSLVSCIWMHIIAKGVYEHLSTEL